MTPEKVPLFFLLAFLFSKDARPARWVHPDVGAPRARYRKVGSGKWKRLKHSPQGQIGTEALNAMIFLKKIRPKNRNETERRREEKDWRKKDRI